ncbi:hypothetical protein [Corynebacterium callunae]|uniref:hypothetical protein n=1 Tax=Corynebacterium callunae TaxID=1721 RepID=UPI001FFE44AF|nr:hypothetical protein [Corynebacterium callunae]MCK2200216.1 hypothetical protein [Corynebacterium callunae]
MEINFRGTKEGISISEMIQAFRAAGLTKTADSLEESMTAKSSISGTYDSVQDLGKVINKVFSDEALRAHFTMATIEARTLDLDPNLVTNLKFNIIQD